ncbi:MAG: hypothetical protein OXH14_15740 [Alphaproteobacteria bacterium]|nr:hypothetical protein [Alphaproteobacteria bacterium]
MDGWERMARLGFWLLALLWLPAGVVMQAAVRFGLSHAAFGASGELLAAMGSLAPVAPCGLPLALGCRRLWRLGYRRTACMAGLGLGAVTIPAAVFVGLLGPVAIATGAVLLGLPVWIAWWWLSRARIGGRLFRPSSRGGRHG